MNHATVTEVLIVDDHSLFRRGLAFALTDLLGVTTVHEASSLDQALEQLHAQRGIDMVFLDLSMPGVAGMESVHALVEGHPTVPIVVVSASEERDMVLGALDAGARGYVPKSLDDDAMAHALQAIAAGEIYVPRSIADHPDLAARNGKPAESRTPLTVDRLTPRQRDVLELLAKGRSNKEIARALDIAEGTVKIHLAALFRVLDVRNRTEAAALAAKLDFGA